MFVNKPLGFTHTTRILSITVLYYLVDYQHARRVALAGTWWSTKSNHFFRTEATDLLKTHDRARDRTQTRTHFRSSPRRKAKGAAFWKTGQVLWFMSRQNLLRTAAPCPSGRNGKTECSGPTLVTRAAGTKNRER